MDRLIKILVILSLSGVIYTAPHHSQTREKRLDCHHPRVSACEECSGAGKLIRCPNGQKFGRYCFREYTYASGGWKTTLGATDEATCKANASKSRLANPNCDLDTPPDGTSCFDCCITPLCHELHSDRCNAINPTNSSLMPDFMHQAGSLATTNKIHTLRPTTLKPTTTPKPTTTTTTPKPTTTTTTPKPTTTTPKPTTTTTTPKPTTTTTPKPTTTPQPTTLTTTPVPTTTQTTTTTSSPTTTSKHGGLCQVCSGDGSSSCNSSQYVYCPGNRPYCMNDIIYDKSGRRQTAKRCVSEIYCYWDWWIGTQNDQKCNTSLSPNVTDDVCHYCCQTGQGDSLPCNVDAIPKQMVSFKKPKKGKMCEVTDLMTGSIQTKECPDSSPFCMNDVFYDKSMASSGYVLQVNKKCVSEFICKGDWWIKSKARSECLSGDISSVNEGNLLCHYCCLSDDTGPCNNETRPKQIYDFLTKTTTKPSATTSTEPECTIETPAVENLFDDGQVSRGLFSVFSDIHHCDKYSIVTALAHNDIVTVNGTNCPDGKHEYSDSLITKYCNGSTWKNWKRGLKVIDNCSKLNRFTPIAAFAGTYFSHDGLAGALLGCNNTEISVVAQSCSYSTKIVHIDKNTRDTYIHNVDNYYTISW